MLYTLQKKKITMLLAGGRECDKLIRRDMLPISVVEGKGLKELAWYLKASALCH